MGLVGRYRDAKLDAHGHALAAYLTTGKGGTIAARVELDNRLRAEPVALYVPTDQVLAAALGRGTEELAAALDGPVRLHAPEGRNAGSAWVTLAVTNRAIAQPDAPRSVTVGTHLHSDDDYQRVLGALERNQIASITIDATHAAAEEAEVKRTWDSAKRYHARTMTRRITHDEQRPQLAPLEQTTRAQSGHDTAQPQRDR